MSPYPPGRMNNKTSALVFALLAVLSAPGALHAQNPAPAEVVYEENFEQPTENLGMKGWFSFSAGSSAKASAAEEPATGVDGSRALVFRFNGADSEGVQSYWLAALGRNAMRIPDGVTPDKLHFSAFMQLPGETKIREVGVRFIQGNSEKPTWTSSHKVEVEPMGNVVTLRLGEGKTTGEFAPGQSVTLHAITFTHDKCGFNRDIEFVLDDVKLGVVRP